MHTWVEPLFPVQAAVAPQQHYLEGKNLTDVLASPIYGDLAGLPPLLLVVGGVEALRDDSVGYVRKAVEAGVPARWHIWQGMPHVHMLMPFLPEAALAERELFAWLDGVAELKRSDSGEPAWRDAVTLFNRRPVTGTLRRSTNSEHVFQRSADSGLV